VDKSVKKNIWNILTAATKKMPTKWIKVLCDLSFESQLSEKNADQGLIVLLEIQNRLRWYLDQQAISYSDGIHPKHRLMNYHIFFTERIRSDDIVLDIGCGCGALAFSIAKNGARVIGMDFNQDNLNQAGKKYAHENITFHYGDVTQEIPPGKYSVVVMSNVLEHLEKRSEILRKLFTDHSPRCLLIRVPMIDRHWDVPLRRELGLSYFLDPTHTVEYTFASFTNEMKKANLEIFDYTIRWGEIWAEVRKVE
jgi:2-polyprenyl-3-methyl-5-hydroxy-6-metoxy-1,4-benzoquinol methylase